MQGIEVPNVVVQGQYQPVSTYPVFAYGNTGAWDWLITYMEEQGLHEWLQIGQGAEIFRPIDENWMIAGETKQILRVIDEVIFLG